jgi:GT2 family glycosyltransferase
MQLSVVIVSYNAAPFLELCLLSVVKAVENLEAEIIVVDNQSTDATCQMVKSNFKEVKLIVNQSNLGFATANNIGVLEAKGDYVLILNPDTVVAEDTFINCLNFANATENLGALGVKLIDGSGHFLPESKRNFPRPLVTFYKMFSVNSKNHAYYATQVAENDTSKVVVLVGAFMLLKRKTYLAVEGFDTDYFMYGEDIDLSYKLSKKGFQNYYLGSESVIHFKGESTKKNVKYLKYFYKAMFIFYKKHLKNNFVFELFLELGMTLWFVIKYVQIKLSFSKKIKIKEAVYLGSNSEVLSQLKKHFGAFNFESQNALNDNFKGLIVFDLSSTSFKNFIQNLEKYKHPQRWFRILLPKSKLLIGSDSANDSGEVVLLN